MQQCDHVKYSQISQILFTDFTPARKTRKSSNPILQEHFTIDKAYCTVRRPASQLYQYLEQASHSERKLRGKYVQVEFAESYPGSGYARSSPVCNCSCRIGGLQDPQESSGETYTGCRLRAAAAAPPYPPPSTDRYRERELTANGTLSPLFVRKRTEQRRTAFCKRSDTGGSCTSTKFASVSTESSGSDASCDSEPLFDVARDMDVESSVVTYHDRLEGANTAMLGCHNEGTEHFDFALNVHQKQGGALVRPVPFQLAAADPQDACESAHSETRSPSKDESMHLQQIEEDPVLISSGEGYAEEYPSSTDETTESPPPYSRHRALARQSAQLLASSNNPPLATPPHDVSPSNSGCRRPLPPPKAKSHGDIYAGSKVILEDSSVVKPASKSSPNLLDVHSPKQQRLRSVSFMDCSAGAELGTFPADYLGCKQVDSFIGYADSLAKGLINSKPIEVVVYVTSEKIRLAPPKNASVLFKSFAVKDILSVQKCSKNRRIVCVAVWKSKKVAPQCHVLRCPSALVSNALYDSVLDQTQNVDDIASDKIPSPSPRSNDITTDRVADYGGSPSSSSSSSNDLSPSEFLHKIPAIHIGCAKASRHASVNDVIQKVLLENSPTASKEVSVWLSLAQLRLVDMSDEREMIYDSHETSRIRAIGVYLIDKRFVGYIVKEEGKPLVGHILRCNSAALMVSLVSFLRQACQIMFSQQGGSLYDELSSDESDTESSLESPTPGQSLMKKLRCITGSHKPLSHTVSQPTFVSHTPPLHQPHSPVSTSAQSSPTFSKSSDASAKHPPLSPLEVPEEQYARFSVTYIGSAIVERPFTPTSLTKSLSLFKERGVAAGKAAVVKNVIQMHVSALGINLIDKKHRLFVHRNYPRKQLLGCCRQEEDDKVFAFGSQRPGYPNEIKCHVFRQLQESTEHIMEAIHHWLDLTPTT